MALIALSTGRWANKGKRGKNCRPGGENKKLVLRSAEEEGSLDWKESQRELEKAHGTNCGSREEAGFREKVLSLEISSETVDGER